MCGAGFQRSIPPGIYAKHDSLKLKIEKKQNKLNPPQTCVNFCLRNRWQSIKRWLEID